MAQDMPGPSAGPSPGEHPDAPGQHGADPAGAGQPPATAEIPLAVAAADSPEPSPKPGKHRKLLYVTLPGCWGALIAGCLSFTPSLLPRGGITQGVVWGITATGSGSSPRGSGVPSLIGTPGTRGAGPGRPYSSVRRSWSWFRSGSGSTGSTRSAS